MQKWLDWLLTTHPQRRIRLQLAGVGTLLMIACVAVLNLLANSAEAYPNGIHIWTVFSIGGLVTFFILIRSGYSERWKDPSMTLAQVTYAIACNAVAYALAGEGRGVVPSILAIILMFCMFGLSVRQIRIVALFALLTFGAAVTFVVLHAHAGQTLRMEEANFVLIVVVLLGGTFLTSHLQQLRGRLRKQKEELETAFEHIRHLASHDELTGLINRRLMNELLEQECRNSERSGRPLSVAILDIDHFKRVNDDFGHAAGDTALKCFAETVSRAIRASDCLARWGGEEFLLMLPETDSDQAMAICLSRVQGCTSAFAIAHEERQFSFTVSIGLSTRRAKEPIDRTIERADQALYAAKDGGRNRVVAA